MINKSVQHTAGLAIVPEGRFHPLQIIKHCRSHDNTRDSHPQCPALRHFCIPHSYCTASRNDTAALVGRCTGCLHSSDTLPPNRVRLRLHTADRSGNGNRIDTARCAGRCIFCSRSKDSRRPHRTECPRHTADRSDSSSRRSRCPAGGQGMGQHSTAHRSGTCCIVHCTGSRASTCHRKFRVDCSYR